ncbi:hypothetical protein ACQP2U_05835 [Nocardia sp. CA-084685]|uniref:hypothetical protein n=1 Tax=Nocardia sp. CA-084685 TaxID=3239970 RepID=UPI003D96D2A7
MTDPWERALDEAARDPQAFLSSLIFTDEPLAPEEVPPPIAKDNAERLLREAEQWRLRNQHQPGEQ